MFADLVALAVAAVVRTAADAAAKRVVADIEGAAHHGRSHLLVTDADR